MTERMFASVSEPVIPAALANGNDTVAVIDRVSPLQLRILPLAAGWRHVASADDGHIHDIGPIPERGHAHDPRSRSRS